MKKALKAERLTKVRVGPTSQDVLTKIADAIKDISSTFHI
jgi:RNA-binding protein YhbY